jgi:cyclase
MARIVPALLGGLVPTTTAAVRPERWSCACATLPARAVMLARRNRVRRLPLVIAVAVCTAFWFVDSGAAVESQASSGGQAPGGASSDSLDVLEVRPNFFMIAGAGANIGVQVGEDGVVVVDAGSTASAPAVVAAIKRITPKPIRYVIDTGPDGDHVGGNDVLSKAGDQFFPGTRPAGPRQDALRSAAAILAAEGVVRHMTAASESAPARPLVGLPTESFHYARKYLYLNGEAIEVLHQPAAHSDSDVFVFFRRSDVVVAGDVIDTRRFPVIDIERGGSIDGEIAALNRLSELAVASVPIVSREAGTVVIPGHGRLCDQFDVVEYRDMITIIRDRVRDLVDAGRSLEQVKASAPAKGYAGRYGNDGGDWTTDRFVEAVYRSLMDGKTGSGVDSRKIDGK